MNKLSESHKTQNQRFGSLLINADFLWTGKEINSDLPKILAPSVRRPGSQIRVLLICAIRLVVTSELARRCFFAETEGKLTFGSPAAFAAGSVCRGNRAKQSNTPSVSPQKRRRPTFFREEGFKKKPPFIIDWTKAKSLFIFYPAADKSSLQYIPAVSRDCFCYNR